MPQLAHIEVGDTPTDITDGLDPGCYIVQVAEGLAEIGDQSVLYATATAAPTDLGDYFRAGHSDFFTFNVAADIPVTWLRTEFVGLTISVALALVPDP